MDDGRGARGGVAGVGGAPPGSVQAENALVAQRHEVPKNVECINVRKMLGRNFCISLTDAARLHCVLEAALREGRGIMLSFAGIRTVMPIFMGAAIGALYEKFEESEIERLLWVVDMSESGAFFMENMVRERKLYKKNPEKYDEWHREFMREIGMV